MATGREERDVLPDDPSQICDTEIIVSEITEWNASTSAGQSNSFKVTESSTGQCGETNCALDQLSALDWMIKKFRMKALGLEEEKEFLLLSLDALKEEDVERSKGQNAEKLESLTKCLCGVELKISTRRDSHEDEALHQVNIIINHLISKVGAELPHVKELVHILFKSCRQFSGASVEEMEQETADHEPTSIAAGFQSTFLKCALDDRRRISRRLQGLLSYIESHEEEMKF